MIGHLDGVDHDQATGWAFDPEHPDSPVTLLIRANDRVIGRVVADQYRADLEAVGRGDGFCAFCFHGMDALRTDSAYEIEVRREGDDSPLNGGPVFLEPRPTAAVANPDPPALLEQDTLGPMIGNLDTADRIRVSGWAVNAEHTEWPVGLAVRVDGQVVGRTLANQFRADLQGAGIGDGNHAFAFILPKLLPTVGYEIRVQRETDGRDLPGSPRIVEPSRSFDSETQAGFADLLADIANDDDETRALGFLTEQTERLLSRRADRDSDRAGRIARREFHRRWSMFLDDTGEAIRPENDTKPRVLVVDERVPSAGRDAGSVAIISHMRAMAELGYEVGFVAARAMEDTAAQRALAEELQIDVYGAPFYLSVEEVLKRQASHFEVVYLHRLSNAQNYLALARLYQPKARILYSVADLHHIRLSRQGEVQQRPELIVHSRTVAFAEFAAAAQANAVITHSAVEAKVLGERIPAEKVHVVPWTVAPHPCTTPFAERSGLAVISQFGHQPSPDSVYWLIRHVMPLVWARDESIRCLIAGYGWSADSLPWRDDRIEIVGPVDDLTEIFSRVRLTAAPLRFGAGIKGKVLESLAAGIPCAMTAVAAEGLPLPLALRRLVGNSAEDMARIILSLHRNETVSEKARIAGLALIEQENSKQRVIEAMAAVLPRAG